MKFKAVVFDLFGTLVDNLSGEAYGEMLAEMAAVLSVPRDDFSREWAATFDKQAVGFFDTWEDNVLHVCRALDIEPEADNTAKAARLLPEFVGREITPRPDAVDTISQLREMGLKIALISDCSMEIPLLWPKLPFAALFDVPIFSCSAGVRKPNPHIYHLACKQLNSKPSDCIYIGDGASRELTGAAKVGMKPVLIRVPYDSNYDQYRLDAAEWEGPIIASLSDIFQLLDGSGVLHDRDR